MIILNYELEMYTELCEEFGISEEAYEAFLYEDYINESSSELMDAKYQEYLRKCKEKGKKPMSKGQWLLKRSRIKKGVAIAATAAGAVGAGIAYKKGVPQKMIKNIQKKRDDRQKEINRQEEDHAYKMSNEYQKYRLTREKKKDKEEDKQRRKNAKIRARNNKKNNKEGIFAKVSKLVKSHSKEAKAQKAQQEKQQSAQRMIDDTKKYNNGLKNFAKSIGKDVDKLTPADIETYKNANGIGQTLNEALFSSLDDYFDIDYYDESYDDFYDESYNNLMDIMYL